MTKEINTITILFLFTAVFSLTGFSSQKLASKKEAQLEADLVKVWPFMQTIKIEYELVLAQLETMDNDSLRKSFLSDYEDYVKDTYFDRLVKLKVRQGKLLLLLIHRELGKTPYDLLVQFRDTERANFWQKFALILDTDLKGRYDPIIYPEIETIVLRLSKEAVHEYIPAK